MPHTPEPWEVREIEGSLYVYFGTRRAIFALADVHPADDQAREDARRVVACVNACAGTPTEFLEALTGGNTHA